MTIINTGCMIIIVVCAAIFMGTHRAGTFVIDRQKRIPDAKAREANRDSLLLFMMKICALIIAIASTILFFTTENMDSDAPLTNSYTYIHIILFVVFMIIYYIGDKDSKKVDPILRKQKVQKEDGFFLE